MIICHTKRQNKYCCSGQFALDVSIVQVKIYRRPILKLGQQMDPHCPLFQFEAVYPCRIAQWSYFNLHVTGLQAFLQSLLDVQGPTEAHCWTVVPNLSPSDTYQGPKMPLDQVSLKSTWPLTLSPGTPWISHITWKPNPGRLVPTQRLIIIFPFIKFHLTTLLRNWLISPLLFLLYAFKFH